MPAFAPAAAIPTKSQIMNWSTTHLDEAATAWEKAADQSERAFKQHVANVQNPGGTVWKGAGAGAAYDDARQAQDTVATQCSVKRECARIARRGAEEIRGAQRAVVSAIDDVQDKGYSVAEDLTVTDASTGGSDAERAARKAEAQELTEYLRWHAQGLASTDAKVAGELTAEAQGLEGRKLSGGDGTTQMLDDHQGGDGQGDGQQTYTAGPFQPDGMAVGGTPGFDKEHNAQGIRGDEGVLIQGNRILYGDSGQVASGKDGDMPYIGTPMYHYHLDERGMPVLDGPPTLEHPELGVEPGHRMIPVGSTGADPMPNGQGLLFGADWGDPPKPGQVDSDFRPNTIVYDTRGNGPFPPVATIQGLRMVTAVPYGDTNQLLVSGVSGTGDNARRELFLTPAQTAPGDWGFLDQKHWTQLPGSFAVNGDGPADTTSQLFRFQTPTGTEYGLVGPNSSSSGIDMRLGSPQGLMNAAPNSIVPDGSYPGTFLYSPNVTQVTPLQNGGFDVSMTHSERLIPPGVPAPQIGRQTYGNVFGHTIITPQPPP